jgi:hypothetical protein
MLLSTEADKQARLYTTTAQQLKEKPPLKSRALRLSRSNGLQYRPLAKIAPPTLVPSRL